MKKIGVSILVLILLGSFAFANGSSEEKNPTSDTLTVSFWTAPNQGQYNFWDAIIQQFNAAGVKVDGKTVQISAQMMPETPSSEAGIQNALATNTAPALSTNINRGFAATLATSGRVYDIQDEQFFEDIIANRKMESIIPSWKIDGKQYVIPIYANAMSYHWNANALRALGFADRVPETTADIKTLLTNFEKLKDTKMKEMGISHVFLRSELGRPELWWNRWYDFEMEYDAFSGGKSLVEDNKLVMDPAVAKQVFEFLGMFGDTIQMSEDTTAFEKKKVPYVFQISAPWDVSKYEAAGLKYGLDGDYVYGAPIVLKKGDIPYTFADAKGLVFYKGGNVTEEMHKGAIAFVSWVYAKDRSAQTDLDWLKTTGMLPMRGDTTTNATLAAYIADKPVLQDQAKLIPHSIPAMANGAMSDILTALGEDGLCDYILQTSKQAPFTAPDASNAVQAAMDGMKTAGSLQ
ncbi:MAG: ABC transporter substrate-binding protein [Spirochaetia bacterium]|jgi:multiple sugar transport system substrate-binding protein|nr:ABC transporter substrate-binding protein [Spirochaetia bacterium]